MGTRKHEMSNDPDQGEQIHVRVPDDPVAIARLRRLLTDVATDAGLSREASFAVRLAVTEAVANALRHPSGEGSAEVRIRVDGDGLEVEVVSHGPFRLRTDTSSADRGRGLPLIVALMDKAAFSRQNGTTSVLLRKRAA